MTSPMVIVNIHEGGRERNTELPAKLPPSSRLRGGRRTGASPLPFAQRHCEPVELGRAVFPAHAGLWV